MIKLCRSCAYDYPHVECTNCNTGWHYIEKSSKHPAYCFMPDGDGHWYYIPVDERRGFRMWIEALENDCETALDYSDFMLPKHISCYCFPCYEEVNDQI